MAKETKEKKPSVGWMIAKIALGVMFIGVSFGDPGESDGAAYLVVGLALGLALIAWGLIPWLRFRKEEKRREEEKDRQRAEEVRRREEEREARENRVYVCPGCGATGKGKVCEYCGTKLG